MKQKARRVNRILNQWTDKGLTSNDLEFVREMLNDFYNNMDKKVKNMQAASENIFLSKKGKEEYNKILDFILYNDEVDLSKRALKNKEIRQKWSEANEKSFDSNKNRFDFIQDEQDFIDFTDEMNRVNKDALLRYIFDSEQIVVLYSISKTRGISFDELTDMAIAEYHKSGKTHNELLEAIIDMIGG